DSAPHSASDSTLHGADSTPDRPPDSTGHGGPDSTPASPPAPTLHGGSDSTPASMSEVPWLILPTYMEAENIERILCAAGAVLEKASPAGFRILVVDDGSPDGTGDIADRLATEHDWVRVLHRTEKNGIGPAYLAGFRHA